MREPNASFAMQETSLAYILLHFCKNILNYSFNKTYPQVVEEWEMYTYSLPCCSAAQFPVQSQTTLEADSVFQSLLSILLFGFSFVVSSSTYWLKGLSFHWAEFVKGVLFLGKPDFKAPLRLRRFIKTIGDTNALFVSILTSWATLTTAKNTFSATVFYSKKVQFSEDGGSHGKLCYPFKTREQKFSVKQDQQTTLGFGKNWGGNALRNLKTNLMLFRSNVC